MRPEIREDGTKMMEAAPRKFHPLVLIPAIITLVWALMVLVAPLTLPGDSVHDLSGVVGIRDNENQTRNMNGFARFVYDSGDTNCHQRASRSLFINGNEMPYCARCTGIFVGLFIGAAFSLFIILDLKVWYIIGALVPMGIDGVGQMLGLWESSNLVRVVTGGLAGVITGIALGFIFFVFETVMADRRRSKAKASTGAAGGGAAPGPQNAESRVGDEEGRDYRQPDGLEDIHGAKDARKDGQ